MLLMKYTELSPGMLVETADGVGIVVKSGVREVACAVSGLRWEHVVLVLINDEPKWYNVEKIQPVD
jgi:hypothetical protein